MQLINFTDYLRWNKAMDIQRRTKPQSTQRFLRTNVFPNSAYKLKKLSDNCNWDRLELKNIRKVVYTLWLYRLWLRVSFLRIVSSVSEPAIMSYNVPYTFFNSFAVKVLRSEYSILSENISSRTRLFWIQFYTSYTLHVKRSEYHIGCWKCFLESFSFMPCRILGAEYLMNHRGHAKSRNKFSFLKWGLKLRNILIL